jgi:hypothetical protein
LLLLLWTATPTEAEGKYRYYCDLQDEPVVTLVWSAQRERYILPDTNGTFNSYPKFPSITLKNNTSTNAPGDDWGEAEAAASDTQARDQPRTVQARRCPCGSPVAPDDFFCPLSQTHCGVPSLSRYDVDEPPGCVTVVQQTNFVRSVWPMLVICYVFLLVFLICSGPGRNVLGCCLSTALPRWNPMMIERIIEQRPAQANGMILRHLRDEIRRERPPQETPFGTRFSGWRRNPNEPEQIELGPDQWILLLRDQATNALLQALTNPNQDESTPQPTSLTLKTRVYSASEEAQRKIESGQGVSDDNHYDPEKGEEGTEVVHQNQQESSQQHGSEHFPPGFDPDDHSCAICYGTLVDGDRVGALPHCEHVFHVDCLKVWLTRRNVCPLCLSENIATPHFANTESTPAGDSEDDVETGNEQSNNNNDEDNSNAIEMQRIEGGTSATTQNSQS